jgi:hypothetical protein
MASENSSARVTRWYQFRIRELLLLALLLGLVGAVWQEGRQIEELRRELHKKPGVSSELLKYSGVASGSIIHRDPDGKPRYLDANGAKVEVYETFLLVTYMNRSLPDSPITLVRFIPRDQLLELTFQPPPQQATGAAP